MIGPGVYELRCLSRSYVVLVLETQPADGAVEAFDVSPLTAPGRLFHELPELVPPHVRLLRHVIR